MTRMEFIPARSVKNPVKYVEDPYIRVDIEAQDHTNVYNEWISSWATTGNPSKIIRASYQGTGLEQASSSSSATFTKTVTIDTAGEYRLRALLYRGPKNISKGGEHGLIKLTVDGVLVEEVDVYHAWEHWKDHDWGKKLLTAGDHTFVLTITNPGLLYDFRFTRVEMYSTNNVHGRTRLGLKSIEFTENNISELNTAEIVIMPREDYYRPDYNEWSRMVFDFMDTVTLYVGADYHDTKVKFGGYIIGYEIDDEGYITLHCADRLLDFQRIPCMRNFNIGIAASEDEESIWPHIDMSSAYETIRYLSETAQRGIDTSRIDYAYGFNLNFGEIADYSSIGVYGFTKTHDKRAGNPPPCLRLGIDYIKLNSIAGDCCSTTITDLNPTALNGTVLLFEDVFGTQYDAATYDFLAFDYLGGGASSKYPLQFNIEITMYKDGETPDEAVAYNILFTGKNSGINNIIHTYPPILNGQWQKFKVNLKKLFDNYCQSSHYYITQIQLTNTFTQTELQNSKDTVMNIDNIMGYSSGGNTKHHIDMETNYPFDVMQTLADESHTVVYVDYGEERRKDVLVMLPEEGKILDEVAEEGFNILGISNIAYLPRDGFVNIAHKFYHVKKDEDETETRGMAANTTDSIIRYGPWRTFEDLTDVDKEADAQNACQNEVDNGAYGTIAFSIYIKGTTILEPCQYLTTTMDTSHLSGTHKIKAIIHNVDFTANPKYTTQIDLGAPSERFKNFMIQFNKRMKYITGKDQRNMYNYRSNRNLNITSPGAFIKTYTSGTD